MCKRNSDSYSSLTCLPHFASHLKWLALTCVAVAVSVSTPLAGHIVSNFELEGDIVGGGASGPDWTDICTAVPADLNGDGTIGSTEAKIIRRDSNGNGVPDCVEVWGGVACACNFDGITCGSAVEGTTYANNNTNNDLIATWNWDTGNVPGKDDIGNAYFYSTIDAGTGHLLVYGGLERRVVNGDTHVDIEFNQAAVGL